MPQKVSVSTSQSQNTEPCIHFSISSFITYTVVVLAIGSSIYTLVSAIPKIETLGEKLSVMDKDMAVSQYELTTLEKDFNEMKQKK